ncbi:MAG: S24/S26 family peptidase [Clostridia bacterium]|nr:S24/S26 family peptidase [Clostridia bacterium]
MTNEKFSSFERELAEHGRLIYTNVGVSMMPLIREGKDVMMIEACKEPPKKLDVVLFVRPHVQGRGHYVVHRILKVRRDGTYFIAGDHDTSGEIVPSECILGILTSLVRDGKPYAFKGFRHWCYLHLRCAPYHARFFVLKAVRGTRQFLRAVKYKLTGK